VSDDPVARVERARSARSSGESAAIYREWAATYDDDVFGTLGFTGSLRIADLLAAHVEDREQAVLDIGCGTGAVGERLGQHGFGAVDGLDISSEMLAVAAGKGCYRHLDVVDLTGAEQLPRSGYGASVSAGTFTAGHVGAEHLGPILDALKPGAVVAWVVAQKVWGSFEQAITGFEIMSAELEPVRAGGAPESVMLVARRR
jgi:trans-aconitate methyltransferase